MINFFLLTKLAYTRISLFPALNCLDTQMNVTELELHNVV